MLPVGAEEKERKVSARTHAEEPALMCLPRTMRTKRASTATQRDASKADCKHRVRDMQSAKDGERPFVDKGARKDRPAQAAEVTKEFLVLALLASNVGGCAGLV